MTHYGLGISPMERACRRARLWRHQQRGAHMENILTFAGCIQLLVALWDFDKFARMPRLFLGLIVFALLVYAVRQVLKERNPAPKRRTPVRRIA